MSGGVDSSVAAARMVDAGHDVVGVHLALSSAPGTLRTGSRGCCSKEDAGDARRVADVLDIPFYVWDFADRFNEAVIDDFVDVLCPRGDTEPVRALQRTNQVLRVGGSRTGAGLRRPRNRSLRATVGRSAAPCGRPRQGPVVCARGADGRAVASCGVPDRRYAKAADSRGGRPPWAGRGREAGQPRHLLHTVGRYPRVSRCADRRAARRGRRREAARCWPNTMACTALPIGQRKGLGIAGPGPDGRPRYVTGIDADTGTVHVGDAADLEVWTLIGERPVFTLRRRAQRPRGVRGSGSCARRYRRRRRRAARRRGSSSTCVLRCVAWRRARRWCSTAPTRTATKSSAARRSRAKTCGCAIQRTRGRGLSAR